MAIRLVNKSKADCDINLFSGRVVRVKPLSYITLDEKITKASLDYYRQLRDLGLYLEKDPEPVIEQKPVEEKVPENNAGEVVQTTVETETSVNTDGDATNEGTANTADSEGKKEDCPCCSSDEVTEKDLMKHNHSKLVELAESMGLGNLEALSKREICAKILEAVSAGK